jgi:drug/metabolite transporter (DMT)-like permease
MAPRSLARLALLALLWGSSFLWIKLALDGLSPVQLVLVRLALGAAVLLLIVRVRRLRLPRDKTTWLRLTVAALVANAIPYLLFAIGEQTVSSSLAGALNATTPLWTLGIGLIARTERQVTARRLVGLLVGFAGALVILAPWNASTASIGGALACLGAAASYGLSYVYMGRRLAGRGLSPLVLSAAQLTAATGLLLVVTPVAGLQPVQLTPAVLAAISILGALGTGAAYVLNYRLITDEGPTATSTVTYLLPVVAVALGIVFLGEPAAAHLLIGTGIVLVGIALVQQRSPAPASTPEAPTPKLGRPERPGRAAPPGPHD